MNRPVNFTVHKNNMQQRKKKQLRKMAVDDIKACVSDKDISGYAMVSWSDNGSFSVAWHMVDSQYLKPHELPSYVSKTLEKKIIVHDGE